MTSGDSALSAVKPVEINVYNLVLNGLDAIEGLPTINIKPYNPRADSVPNARLPERTWKDPLNLAVRLTKSLYNMPRIPLEANADGPRSSNKR